MPKDISRKVKIRSDEAYQLIKMRGCITTKDVMELGFTHSQALSALTYLQKNGVIVRVKVGDKAGDMLIWCRSRKTAVKRLRELKHVLHAVICKAGIKYVTIKRALDAIMNDDTAKRLFAQYVTLDIKSPATRRFINKLLEVMYGGVLYKKGDRTPVYFADCSKSPKPFPSSLGKSKGEYRTVNFRVDKELEEEIRKAAEIEGVSISALVRRALERYLANLR